MYRRPIAIIAISLFFIQMLPLQNTAHLHAAPPPGQTSDLPNLDTDLCFNLLYQALNRGSLTIPSTVFLNWDAQEKLNFISERYKLPKKDANEFYSSALRALYGNHPNELCKALTMCLNGSEHSNPIQHALIVKYSGYSDESLNLALSAYKEAMKRSDALGYVYLMRMAQILRDYPDLHNALGVGSIRLELKALRASDSLNCVQVQRMIKEYLPFSFGQIMLPTLRDYYFVCYDAEYDSNDTNKFLKSLQPVKSRLLALKQSTDDPTNDLLMQRALLEDVTIYEALYKFLRDSSKTKTTEFLTLLDSENNVRSLQIDTERILRGLSRMLDYLVDRFANLEVHIETIKDRLSDIGENVDNVSAQLVQHRDVLKTVYSEIVSINEKQDIIIDVTKSTSEKIDNLSSKVDRVSAKLDSVKTSVDLTNQIVVRKFGSEFGYIVLPGSVGKERSAGVASAWADVYIASNGNISGSVNVKNKNTNGNGVVKGVYKLVLMDDKGEALFEWPKNNDSFTLTAGSTLFSTNKKREEFVGTIPADRVKDIKLIAWYVNAESNNGLPKNIEEWKKLVRDVKEIAEDVKDIIVIVGIVVAAAG